MNTREWAVKKLNKWQQDVDKLSRVVHSRCESIRGAAGDFEKENVKELMREAKGKMKEFQKIVARLPAELGRVVTGTNEVELAPEEQELPLGEEAA